MTGYVDTQSEQNTQLDSDTFALLHMEAGRTYRIDLEGASTDRGTLGDPKIGTTYYLDSNFMHNRIYHDLPNGTDSDSGELKNAQVTVMTDMTTTHYVGITSENGTTGTYRLTVQEILDDLGVWHTDWGAEEPGGFLQPNNQANGNLYGADATQRSGGQRDKDAFLFYLGSDKAPMGEDYVLVVSGLHASRLSVETFYDLSDLDAYIDNFSLDDDFIEFPDSGSGNPDPDVSDAEAGRLRSVAPRPVGTRVGSTGDEHRTTLFFSPGADDIGAYLAFVSGSDQPEGRETLGNYQIFLRRDVSRSEMDGENFNLDWLTQGYVRVGDAVTGTIDDGGGDLDTFATLLREGRTYLIEARGAATNHGTMPDPGLTLQVPHPTAPGSLNLACSAPSAAPGCSQFDNDSGEGLNAELAYSPGVTELHFITVYNSACTNDFNQCGDDKEGTYTLSVTDVTGIPRIVAEGGAGDLQPGLRRHLRRR